VGVDGSAVEATGGTGELAIGNGWPSMFRGYLGDDDRDANAFVGDWYRTGDIVRRDDDGYFWFVARSDGATGAVAGADDDAAAAALVVANGVNGGR
jgi:acyl-coenzyme A synthetase/AMP-(fatty) acid ligase